MRISTAEISSYVKCPLLFLEGHQEEPKEKKIVDSLRRAVQYLYSHHMAHGEICNFNALIKRWNQIWWGKRRPDDSEAAKLSNKAYMAIDQYYNVYLDREYDGAYTNWPYAVEIGPHIVTGVWPVILTTGSETELYYPMSQKSSLDMIRNITVKTDIVAMHASTGSMPSKVTYSRYFPQDKDDLMKFGTFYPKEDWFEKAAETLASVLRAIDQGYVWGNSHQCRTCVLRNRCTG